MSCPESSVLEMIRATFKAQVVTALSESCLTLESISQVVGDVLNEVKEEIDEEDYQKPLGLHPRRT
jgi:hypothetical protein